MHIEHRKEYADPKHVVTFENLRQLRTVACADQFNILDQSVRGGKHQIVPFRNHPCRIAEKARKRRPKRNDQNG